MPSPPSLRRLKFLVTPLHSFRTGLIQLAQYVAASPELNEKVPSEARKRVTAHLLEFKAAAQFREPADLKLIRDKLGAHVDRRIQPWDAEKALRPLTARQLGEAIHLCLASLVAFLDLNIYAWTATDCPDGFVRLMNVEPSLVTLQMRDGEPFRIDQIELVDSPRAEIFEYCRELANATQCLFEGQEAAQAESESDA